MTYVRNISNWPDPSGPEWDMSQNYSLSPYKGNFPGKTKKNRSTRICLKYNLSTSLLSTLMTYVKNISNWPDPGGQKMDMMDMDIYLDFPPNRLSSRIKRSELSCCINAKLESVSVSRRA